MAQYRLTQRAEADLFDIFSYGYRVFGRDQADRYRQGLTAAFEMLGAHPGLGRPADSVEPGLRRHEHGRHVILYEDDQDGVLIVAILHGRRLMHL